MQPLTFIIQSTDNTAHSSATEHKPSQPQYNKEHYMAPWIMEELTICNLLPLQSLRTRNNRGGGRRGNPGTNLFRCNIAVICRLLCALFVFKQNRISSVAYASLPTFSFSFFFLRCATISAQKGENMLRCEIGNHPERYGLISPIS